MTKNSIEVEDCNNIIIWTQMNQLEKSSEEEGTDKSIRAAAKEITDRQIRERAAKRGTDRQIRGKRRRRSWMNNLEVRQIGHR